MRVLVFRPLEDAERSAQTLRERGKDPVVAPLFQVLPTGERPPKGPFDALVLTSANAVPALENLPKSWRGTLPAFCVGTRTADAAGKLDFTAHSARGGRAELLTLILEHMPKGKKLLLVAGRDRHEDLPQQLRDAGHEVTIWTAYEAKAVETLPAAAVEALRDGSADAALHYSPRSAEVFFDLAGKAELAEQARALPQLALSAAIAAPLISAGSDTVLVAEHPEEAALFAALDQLPSRTLLAGDAKEPAATDDKASKDGMTAEPSSDQGQAGKRRTRSGRTPPTIELAATETVETPPVEAAASATTAAEAERIETAAEAVLPTEALPEEFTPPPVPEHQRRYSLPTVALAGLAGGVIGAGLVLLGLRLSSPDDGARLTELTKRVETLQAQSAAIGAVDRKAAAAAESAAKASSEAQANAARLAELANAPPAGGSIPAGLNEKLDRADSNAAAARDAAATLGQRLAGVEAAAKNAAQPSRQAIAAARVVLAERIRDAIGSGRPFQADLTALGDIPAEQKAALAAVAGTGAPTRDKLLAQFKSHHALFVRETTPAANSWEDKLLGLASRIVTIRPVGESGSSDPATLPIRLEGALVQNDIVKAAELWTQLPEPARRGSEAFGAALKQRASAETTINRIAQDAVAALGTAG
ncbi:uroporphyrinogen-III synthase [Bosea sp. (in: a-proteobacteria)]|uniref:uroporphyrinogen-III synthase n=1 Tax=Bosea sp. (in: a-proteobacteria) TaxID=1871050 RepID=UPI0025C5D39F|nr:uroporphyrinogen-III synthase [Bosea sp. (in: a-proteobacteria)]MBR3193220.1 uroporphyrinogen-III synthase [Bosea sp. (in: a-proteobacteria)]